MNGEETVLVTGASSGIGLELAKCFAADGARLVLTARHAEALESLAAELHRAYGTDIVVLPGDLSLPETPERIFRELQGRGVAVDVLVNNAGFGLWGRFADLPLQRQLDMLQVNVTALVHLTGLFLPGMVQRRRGGVLNVASVAGFLPGPGMSIYYASKSAVLSFTEALARELAGTHVTATVVCPGPTITNFGNAANFPEKVRLVRVSRMSAKAVARSGLRAFRRKSVIAIPGLHNRMIILMTKHLPRRLMTRLVGMANGIQAGKP